MAHSDHQADRAADGLVAEPWLAVARSDSASAAVLSFAFLAAPRAVAYGAADCCRFGYSDCRAFED